MDIQKNLIIFNMKTENRSIVWSCGTGTEKEWDGTTPRVLSRHSLFVRFEPRLSSWDWNIPQVNMKQRDIVCDTSQRKNNTFGSKNKYNLYSIHWLIDWLISPIVNIYCIYMFSPKWVKIITIWRSVKLVHKNTSSPENILHTCW